MAEFLLVHGSCHGAWCWRDTIPALARLGHVARAIDLPGHGGDTTPVSEVTLDLYRDAILAAANPDTIVVGHSMAGYPISAAADRDPEGLRGLVYLCAYVPSEGLSLAQMRRRAPRQPLLPAIRRAPDGLSFAIDPAMAREVFYHDCSDDDAAYAIARLCAQPVAPQETPLALGAGYDRVPRAYIRCTDDRTIPPEYQVSMTQDWPRTQVHEMAVSHSPFLADPEGLARVLDRISGTM